MPLDDGGSVTRWIGDLGRATRAAARRVWERYFDRLVRLARKRLAGRAGGVEDEEDAALSRLRQLLRGAGPRAVHRACRPRRSLEAAGRDHGPEGGRPGRSPAGPEARRSLEPHGPGARRLGRRFSRRCDDGFLAELVAREPTPEFAAMVAEETRPAARPPGRRAASADRSRPDGGLHDRRDRRSARLRPADGRPPPRPDPPDLERGTLMIRRDARHLPAPEPVALSTARSAATPAEEYTAAFRSPLSQRDRLDALCARFEEAWRAGQSPRIEAFLAGIPRRRGRAGPRCLLELLALEVELRQERRRADLRSACYQQRFPDHADVVARVFADRSLGQAKRRRNRATGTCARKPGSMRRAGSAITSSWASWPAAAWGWSTGLAR